MLHLEGPVKITQEERRLQAEETAGAEAGGCEEQERLGLAHGSLWPEQKLERVEVRVGGTVSHTESWVLF